MITKNHMGIEIRSQSGREVPQIKNGSLAWEYEPDPDLFEANGVAVNDGPATDPKLIRKVCEEMERQKRTKQARADE